MLSEQQPLRPSESCLSDKQILAWHQGELTDSEAEQVLSHLATCSHCSSQEHLLLYQEQDVLRLIDDLAPQQDYVPDRVAAFARLSKALEEQQLPIAHAVATQQTPRLYRRMVKGSLTAAARVQETVVHFWLVCRKQISVIHKSIWYLTALMIFLVDCAFNLLVPQLLRNISALDLPWILALLVTTASMVGVVYVQSQDSGAEREIVLSTPTSMATIVFARVLLVVGYNMLLATASTVLLAYTLGGGVWGITLQWLGPLLFFSTIGIVLSQFVKAELAVMTTLLLEVILCLSFSFERGIPTLRFVQSSLWHTSPLLLGVALLLMAFAVFNAPRRMRWLA